MGKSLTSCQTTIISGIPGGDHVGGIIWLLKYTPLPYGGISQVSNFPFGEQLAQPELITTAVHMVPTWLAAQVVGPVCGWNLMVLAGYMLTALSMYGFIYWLLRSRGVATFAALAITFTPYHYFKSWGHLSYIHSEIFILILWCYLAFWKNPDLKKSILLGFLGGLLFYSDGYFPLIGGALVSSLVLYSAGYTLRNLDTLGRQFAIKRLRYLIISAIVAFVMLLPVMFVQMKFGGAIKSSLSNSRSDVTKEATTYGARLADYVLPSQQHPVEQVRDFVNDYRKDNPYSNQGEYHLYLGMIPIILALVGIVHVSRKRQTKDSQARWLHYVAWSCATVLLAALLISFIPRFTVFGFTFPLPSGVITNLVSFWRVFARLYLAASVALITISAIGLHYLLKNEGNQLKRRLFLTLIIIFTLIDLMPFNPFNRQDQQSLDQGNKTYLWLRDQPSIPAVAAYPVLGHPFDAPYFSDQVIHNKPLMTSHDSVDPEQLLHNSLAGLSDPQTLGVLKQLGINHVLLYQIPEKSLPAGLKPLYGELGARVAQINSDLPKLRTALVPDANFGRPVVDQSTQVSCRQPTALIASLSVRRLAPDAPEQTTASFILRGQPGQSLVIHDAKGNTITQLQFTEKNQLVPVSTTSKTGDTLFIYHLSGITYGLADVCMLSVSN